MEILNKTIQTPHNSLYEITEESLKNTFVIFEKGTHILRFSDGYIVIYGSEQSANDDMIEGDSKCTVLSLHPKLKEEAISSIRFHNT